MRDLLDVELKVKNGKWRLSNHVFDVPLDWADGMTACEVCSMMLSLKPGKSFVQQEEHRQMYGDVVVVNCPNQPTTKKGKGK